MHVFQTGGQLTQTAGAAIDSALGHCPPTLGVDPSCAPARHAEMGCVPVESIGVVMRWWEVREFATRVEVKESESRSRKLA